MEWSLPEACRSAGRALTFVLCCLVAACCFFALGLAQEPAPAAAAGAARSALTTHLTYGRTELLERSSSVQVSIPKWDPELGELDHVSARGFVWFVPPTWHEGEEPRGAVFEVEDILDNDHDAVCRWGFDGCPPLPGQAEGDVGGPWQKARFKLGGQVFVAARAETGLVLVEDAFDAFGRPTIELHGKDAEGDELWQSWSDLERWAGTGDWVWTIEGSYGGNASCSSSDASFRAGWRALVQLQFTYSYIPSA